MKRTVFVGIVVLSVGVFLLGCEGDRGPAGPQGEPGTNLTINTVHGDPFTLEPSDTSVITVSVTYAGDSTLTYSWTAEGGIIIGSGSVIRWEAPVQAGYYVISVSVSDGEYSADGHVTLRVTEICGAGATWTELYPTGEIPDARGWHATIYDGLHQQMVIYGGYDQPGTFYHDCYALDLESLEWHKIPPPYPTGREDAVAVWDEPNDRMILYGGGHAGAWYNSTYALDLTSETWIEVTTSVDGSVPGDTPPRRAEPAGIYDPVGQRMVVFAGRSSSYQFNNDTYALSLGTPGSEQWSRIHAGGASAPEARNNVAAIYDPVTHAMIVFGGGLPGGAPLNDLWSFDLSNHTWTELQPSGQVPKARASGRQLVYMPSRRWMVVFSCISGNDLWALDLDSMTWHSFGPCADGWPEQRHLGSFIYDSQNDHIILWSGYDNSAPYLAWSDCWMLTFE